MAMWANFFQSVSMKLANRYRGDGPEEGFIYDTTSAPPMLVTFRTPSTGASEQRHARKEACQR
jgi:hypothetical protein